MATSSVALSSHQLQSWMCIMSASFNSVECCNQSLAPVSRCILTGEICQSNYSENQLRCIAISLNQPNTLQLSPQTKNNYHNAVCGILPLSQGPLARYRNSEIILKTSFQSCFGYRAIATQLCLGSKIVTVMYSAIDNCYNGCVWFTMVMNGFQ